MFGDGRRNFFKFSKRVLLNSLMQTGKFLSGVFAFSPNFSLLKIYGLFRWNGDELLPEQRWSYRTKIIEQFGMNNYFEREQLFFYWRCKFLSWFLDILSFIFKLFSIHFIHSVLEWNKSGVDWFSLKPGSDGIVALAVIYLDIEVDILVSSRRSHRWNRHWILPVNFRPVF